LVDLAIGGLPHFTEHWSMARRVSDSSGGTRAPSRRRPAGWRWRAPLRRGARVGRI